MTAIPPAAVGMALEEVDTPALLIDLDSFERNLRRLADAVEGTPVRLRPHAKTHKCPTIALKQMALGAVGVCCQKVGEAEAMVNGGVPNVLVSNEIVGASKVARLAALARHAEVMVCADDPLHVEQLSEAAQAFSVELPVLVEVDVGAPRCGVAPGQPALELARRIEGAPGLRFGGLQAYQGAAQHLRPIAERKEAIQAAVHRVRECLELFERDGIPCERVSGAGTGTYPFERDSGVYTELQAGSYVFMDADYAQNLAEDGAPVSTFEHSLFVYTTVMSRPIPERAVVDAGLKAYTLEMGKPWVHGMPDVEVVGVSDEHGALHLSDPSRDLRLGRKLMLIPGHCDPTVNLHDWYVCIRGGRVEALWPISARGAIT
ncbi:MAG: DSD1 family PLP-dependent enzyme [SAR324 cluster bacterium]|nr:DSD1 family PLP-dependent enzyme [SAR324 cluster bacterium]